MIFHVDANSFYASCERLFRPDLADKPIVVLSNNDGIVIALNAEAKALGVKRGDVWYKIAEACSQKGITAFSSNYTLYADISSRIVSIYNRLCPDVEVYSIDECFLYYPDWKCPDYEGIAWRIRTCVQREIGIPVSVGIAPTRTLAKIANKLAKKANGVYSLAGGTDQSVDAVLADLPAADVWGIGWSKAAHLQKQGIQTAKDLKEYPLHLAKKHMTITGMRTIQELNGIAAMDRQVQDANKNICSSKSFARPVLTLAELEEALASYTNEAVRKLREQSSAVRCISVFLMTNPWDDSGTPYYNQCAAALPESTSYLPDILETAISLLHKIYRSGHRYRKIMINLLDLTDDTQAQAELFPTGDSRKEDKQALMRCFDQINSRYGRTMLRTGSHTTAERTWAMRRQFLSPAYTTDLAGIPEVH
ncbi:MAG: Y-family DNA polymerase [Spirochaetales bacterium]|nr:Y-family DNA polymerase [Spirochaetales bacterium]